MELITISCIDIYCRLIYYANIIWILYELTLLLPVYFIIIINYYVLNICNKHFVHNKHTNTKSWIAEDSWQTSAAIFISFATLTVAITGSLSIRIIALKCFRTYARTAHAIFLTRISRTAGHNGRISFRVHWPLYRPLTLYKRYKAVILN